MSTLEHGFVIDSVEAVQLLLTPHPDIKNGMLLGTPINKRGLLLEAVELERHRQWSASNCRFGIFVMNDQTARALLDLQPCDPSIVAPFIKLGDQWYSSLANSHNRRMSEARLGSETKPGYVHDMLNNLWGFADPLIVGADGKIGSAQHRGAAYLRALAVNPELGPIEFPIIWGISPVMMDFLDRGRERKESDMEYRDETAFTEELLSSVFEELPSGKDFAKLRQTLSEDITAVRKNVHARCRGIDVHPSGQQAPSKRDALLVDSRFETETDLQRLVSTVVSRSVGEDGKPLPYRKVWTTVHVSTALVLRCNKHHDDSSSLVLDWDYVDEFLTALASSSGEPCTGPFGPALADIQSAMVRIKKDGGTKPNDKELFGCLVAATSQFDSGGETDKVWPTKRQRATRKKSGETFRIFGGVDCGPATKDE